MTWLDICFWSLETDYDQMVTMNWFKIEDEDDDEKAPPIFDAVVDADVLTVDIVDTDDEDNDDMLVDAWFKDIVDILEPSIADDDIRLRFLAGVLDDTAISLDDSCCDNVLCWLRVVSSLLSLLVLIVLGGIFSLLWLSLFCFFFLFPWVLLLDFSAWSLL